MQLLSFVASLILIILQDIDIIHSLTSRGKLEQFNVMGVCQDGGKKPEHGYMGPGIWQLPVLA